MKLNVLNTVYKVYQSLYAYYFTLTTYVLLELCEIWSFMQNQESVLKNQGCPSLASDASGLLAPKYDSNRPSSCRCDGPKALEIVNEVAVGAGK